MTDKTSDAEDSGDLPYRYVYSPITDEVYVLSFGFHGLGVSNMFANRPAFHRYMMEGIKFDDMIADKVIQQSQEILGEKQV